MTLATAPDGCCVNGPGLLVRHFSAVSWCLQEAATFCGEAGLRGRCQAIIEFASTEWGNGFNGYRFAEERSIKI